jgi:hypothetical protein
MDLGETQEIALLVSRERSIGELQAELDAVGPTEGEQVKASETMEAQLAGIGFAIEPLTPALQLVAGEGVTQWRWAVEATKSGEQRLHLTLSAVFDRNGKALQDRLGGFFDENWQWLWATLFVPLVGWLLRQRRRGKAEEPPPSALQP